MTSPLWLIESVAANQDGLITAEQCRAAGMSPDAVSRQVKTRAWQALFRGVYAITPAAVTVRQRIRAGLLALGPAAVAVLTSAGILHGWPVLPPDETVQASLPGARARRDQPGLTARQIVLTRDHITAIDGMPVTTPARTAADLAVRLSRPEAVAMLDAALNGGRLTAADLDAALALIHGRRGAVRARNSIADADGRAQSPLESRIRLICVDGGTPPEELQFRVYDNLGILLSVADLAWPSRRLLVEADGRLVHGAPSALLYDRWRQNELIARGYTILRFTWADTQRPAYIVGMIRRALGLAPAA